jgi:hypothetical protein
MKHHFCSKTDYSFPVNHFKTQADENQNDSTSVKGKSIFKFRQPIEIITAEVTQLKMPEIEINISGRLIKSSRQFNHFISTMLLSICKLFGPQVENFKNLKRKVLENVIIALDVFFDFMEYFLFIEEELLQPSAIMANSKISNAKNSQNEIKLSFSGSKHLFAMIKEPAIVQAFTPLAKFLLIETKTLKVKTLKKLPKIKLPLKTNHPVQWLVQLTNNYPVGEHLRLIVSKCISKLFLHQPKHPIAGSYLGYGQV